MNIIAVVVQIAYLEQLQQISPLGLSFSDNFLQPDLIIAILI